MAEENQNESIIKKPQDDGMEMVMNTNLELEKEQKSEKNEEKTGELRYIKPDSPNGYITDKDEIEQYKYRQQIDIMKNRLLGDYNEKGEYVLSNEIIYELRNIKKEVIEQYKTYLFLHSVFPIQGFGKISFFVSVSKLDDGKLKARLVLLEKIDKANGMITNTQSVVVDEFIDEASPVYYTKMKEQFKIIAVDQKNIDEENQDDLKYCRMRKMKMVHLWELISGEVEKKEKESFEKKMKILEEMKDKDPNAKALWDQLQRELEKAKIFTNGKSDKNISYSDILNSLLERNADNSVVEALKEKFKEADKVTNKDIKKAAEKKAIEKSEDTTQMSGPSQQNDRSKDGANLQDKQDKKGKDIVKIAMGAKLGNLDEYERHPAENNATITPKNIDTPNKDTPNKDTPKEDERIASDNPLLNGAQILREDYYQDQKGRPNFSINSNTGKEKEPQGMELS